MAGHSKWKQIKHKKALTDTKKGKLFSKLVREITLAAKVAGSSPDTNPRLRAAIERARASGLPKDNIERAILRSSGAGEEAALQEFLYEASAPGGVALLIEGITDNKNRSLAQIRKILTEHNARLADPGSLLWQFEKIGVIDCGAEENPTKTKEEIELAFIESGARDFAAMDGTWIIETEFTELERVRRALEENGITVRESGHDYKPRNPVTLSAMEKGSLEPLLDTLTEDDDVQEVYTNLEES